MSHVSAGGLGCEKQKKFRRVGQINLMVFLAQPNDDIQDLIADTTN